ncbi:MAG: translation elongation factor 4 [Patescibacteria group bacterium]|jgi:GTP-binding protein LepA|nr:translation elongation factor 4 [Patescibacteria group bacterium]
MQNKIRNFCIIAHIDHGKSTLADRMLELTGTVEKRNMQAQLLDGMDIERERGITIKLQPVKMSYKGYDLNLIDTPGHVDFSYEVSRSLAAVEGAILLVDSTQGIQAQTLANLYLAMDLNLKIIPVINKIDLPAADIEKTKNEIINLLGCDESEIISASGKTGVGVEKILDRAIEIIENPTGDDSKPPRALIFDSNYDEYRGVVAFVRMVDGAIKKGDKIKLLATGAESDAIDVGFFKPKYVSSGELKTGDIGYIVTGFKGVDECRVGDTISLLKSVQKKEVEALKGYTDVKPMVFAGVYPQEGNDYAALREAIGKLKLNDSALSYEPEQSNALGFGFRCGFLGILHLEIFQERLRREHNIELIVTLPSVAYRIHKLNGEDEIIRTPQKLPERSLIEYIEEPWVNLDIIVPKEYIGAIMSLTQEKRGIYKTTEYIDDSRAIIHYQIPMAAILTDYYDKIKSVSSGYASINYEYYGFSKAEVVRMDILVAEEKVEALATIVYEDEAFLRGKEVVKILKDSLPRQMFAVKLQAAVGAKIVAAERMSAFKKDVTAGLYGGDVSRKRKLLEKQKKGKKKMAQMGKGKVDIPPDTFVKLLKK